MMPPGGTLFYSDAIACNIHANIYLVGNVNKATVQVGTEVYIFKNPFQLPVWWEHPNQGL